MDNEFICKGCGTKIEANNMFCTNCGMSRQRTILPPKLNNGNGNNKNKYIATTIIILALLLCGGGVYMTLNSPLFYKNTDSTLTTTLVSQDTLTSSMDKTTEKTIEGKTNEVTIETKITNNIDDEYVFNYIVSTKESDLNIRSAPGISFESIGRVPKDTQLYVMQIVDGWGYTEFKGRKGWVSMEFLKPLTQINIAPTTTRTFTTKPATSYSATTKPEVPTTIAEIYPTTNWGSKVP